MFWFKDDLFKLYFEVCRNQSVSGMAAWMISINDPHFGQSYLEESGISPAFERV